MAGIFEEDTFNRSNIFGKLKFKMILKNFQISIDNFKQKTFKVSNEFFKYYLNMDLKFNQNRISKWV
jgi:hypothetical protein